MRPKLPPPARLAIYRWQCCRTIRNAPQPDLPEDLVKPINEAWEQMQEELSHLSTRGKRVVAKNSGHYIQLDRPELVIDAIRTCRRRRVRHSRHRNHNPNNLFASILIVQTCYCEFFRLEISLALLFPIGEDEIMSALHFRRNGTSRLVL